MHEQYLHHADFAEHTMNRPPCLTEATPTMFSWLSDPIVKRNYEEITRSCNETIEKEPVVLGKLQFRTHHFCKM